MTTTTMGRTVRVSEATWRRLQALGTGFTSSELGTPEKIIEMLLDEYEEEHEPPESEGAATRKQHVRGPSQDRLLADLRETGGGELPTLAEFYGCSEATIRRKAEGLVHQGKLRVETGTHGTERARMPRFYMPVEEVRREAQPGA